MVSKSIVSLAYLLATSLRILLSTTVALLFWFGHSNAADFDLSQLPAQAEELTAANDEVSKSFTDAKRLDDAAAPKVKAIKLWDSEIARMKPQYDDMEKLAKPLIEEGQKHSAALARFGATCAHVSRSDNSRWARCNGERVQLDAWAARLTAKGAEFNASMTKLNKHRDEMVKARNDLNHQIQEDQALQNAIKKWQAAKARVEKAQAWLNQAYAECKKLKSEGGIGSEALHYCNSITWDNALPGLPPL